MTELLLLHGALGTKTLFSELEKELNKQFNVNSINFSGHGNKPLPDESFSNELFACDVLKWMDNEGLHKINIFGHSMGGYVGLYLASKYPERINKVFTIGTKLEWNEEVSAQQVKMLDADKIKQKVPKFAEELIRRHGENKWEALLDKTKNMMTALGNNSGIKLTSEDFRKIECEVWLGIGDMDNMVTLEETEEVCSCIKNGRVNVLQNTPHQLEQMNIKMLEQEIEKFLKM